MKFLNKLGPQGGYGILEGATAIVIFLPLVLAGLALCHYCVTLRAINSILEQSAHEEIEHPFHLLAPELEELLRVRFRALQKHAENTTQRMHERLITQFGGAMQNPEAYQVEYAFANFHVGTKDGRLYAIRDHKSDISQLGGLHQKFAILSISDSLKQLEHSSQDVSAYAMPTALQGVNSIQHYGYSTFGKDYLRTTVLLGLKISISLEGTLAGSMLDVLDIPPYLSRQMIVPMRGQF